MKRLVIDASVGATFVIPSQRTLASDVLLRTWDDYDAFAPYVFSLEMPWLLLKQERRFRQPGLAAAGIAQLARLSLTLTGALEPSGLSDAFASAIRHNMGFFDAMYVRLAVDIEAVLATRDAAQATVARSLGVEVLDVR